MDRIGFPSDDVLLRVADLAEEVVSSLPVEILYLEWATESGKRILRVYIDHREGASVQVGDCAQVSQALEMALEASEPIAFPYTLEVSSPGLNRPLARRKDFELSQGKIVKVEAREPINGRRRFHGRLLDLAADEIGLDIDGTVFHIPLAAIKRASLDYFASEKK